MGRLPAWASSLPELLWTHSPNGAWLTRNLIVQPESNPEAVLADLEKWDETKLAATVAEPATDQPTKIVVDDPAADQWRKAVDEVRQTLATGGAIEKVVLARRVDVQAEQAIGWYEVLARLAQNYPDCYLFAIARNDRCFVGATPEQLVKLEAGRVEAMGLAGSAPRHGRCRQ